MWGASPARVHHLSTERALSRLHRISGCDNSEREADVVFIHGLGGNAFTTWTDEHADTMWPRWLGEDFPQVGVWSLEYAASPSFLTQPLAWWSARFRDAGQALPLSERARQVLDRLAQTGIGERPLLLICHSLGGLLAKAVLRAAHESSAQPKRRAILDATRAVLFLATPHAGATLATRLVALPFPFASAALKELRADSPAAMDLHDSYCDLARSAQIETCTYYETRKYLRLFLVVTRSSAHPGVGRAPVGLDYDHLAIAKPSSRDAEVYRAAVELLRDYVLTPAARTVSEESGPKDRAFALSLTDAPAGAIVRRFLGNALESQLEVLAGELTGAAKSEIELAQAAWREGRRDDARASIQALADNSASLDLMDPVVAARVLRTAVGMTLDDEGDLEGARRLLAKARSFDPAADDARLRAAILERAGSRVDAIALLEATPSSSAQNLRATLLLIDGQLDAASAVTEGHTPTEVRDVVERWRIRAMIRFSRGELPEALETARSALGLAPADLMVRYLVAVLQYFGGLRGRLPSFIVSWPQPADPSTLRRDTTGVDAFTDTAATFAQLLLLQLSQTERRYFQTWRVAALANVTALRSVAVEFAKEVLARDASHPYMLLWAAFLDVDVDLNSYFTAVETALRASFDLEQAGVLLLACLATERVAVASTLLELWKPEYDAAGATEAWTYWRAQAALALDDFEAARAFIAQLPAKPARAVRALLRAAEARRSGDPAALVAELEASAAETGDPAFLLQACQQQAAAENWPYVRRHVDQLMATLPSPESRRLAIYARLKSREVASAALLLDQVLDGPDEGDDRVALRRLRAAVREGLGNVAGALEDMRIVVERPDDAQLTADLLVLARLHFTLGERREFAICAARLKERVDLSATDALQVAQVVQEDDAHLAAQLWHVAVGREIPDESVTLALTLGYGLGLDAELGALTARMSALAAAGHPSVQQFSMDELTAFMEDRFAQQEKTQALYRRGELGTLFAAQSWNVSLVEFYHTKLWEQEQRRSLRGQFAVQLRSGARGLPEPDGFACAPGRLALDLSALLLAQHLDLLPVLEQEFGPIRLPHDIIAALHAERNHFVLHQPSRLGIARALLEAERRGQVQRATDAFPSLIEADATAAGGWSRWIALLERACVEQAFVLDLPLEPALPHGRPVAVAGTQRLSRIVTVASVRAHLAAWGAELPPVSAVELSESSEGRRFSPTVMARGSVLFLTDAGAEALTSAGLLSIAADYFSLLVDPLDQDARAASVAGESQRREYGEWVERLRQRVADGLADGHYALLPTGAHAAESGDEDAVGEPGDEVSSPQAASARRPQPLPFRVLRDLIALPEGTVDAIWIEDRSFTSYPVAGTTRLVDGLQVLAALERTGRISASEKWARWLRLRAANVRILPMCRDEIVYHLQQARIKDGQVVETRALEILRQSAAILIEDASALQLPSAQAIAAGQLGDLPVLVGYARAVHDALLAVWKPSGAVVDDAARAEMSARATWIAKNLFVDLGLLRIRVVTPDLLPETAPSAVGAANLLMRSIELLGTRSAPHATPDDAHARAFGEWMYHALILDRAERDAAFDVAHLDQLKHLLTTSAMTGAVDGTPRVESQLLAGRLYETLPEALRSRLAKDTTLMDLVARNIIDTLSWDAGRVAIRDFAIAGAAAARGEQASVALLGTESPVSAQLSLVGPNNFELRFPDGTGFRARNAAFCVLRADPAQRLAGLEACRRDADLPRSDWRALVARITAMTDPAERLLTLLEVQRDSVRTRYATMVARWRNTGELSGEDFRGPSPEPVLAHLRFPTAAPGMDWPARRSAAAVTLLEEEGPEEAFQRLAGIPLPLPPAATAYFEGMDETKRRALVVSLLRAPSSPIALLHGIRLLGSVGDANPAYRRLARRLARRVASDEWKTDVALLRGVAMRTHADYWMSANDAGARGARLIATWYHAHRMVCGMPESSDVRAEIAAMVAERMRDTATRVFDIGNIDEQDIGHPLHVDSWRLAAAGLQYAATLHSPFADRDASVKDFLTRFTWATGDTRVPRYELLREPLGLSNECGTWLPIRLEADGAIRLASHDIVPAAMSPAALRAHALEGLEQDPFDVAPWITLELVSSAMALTGSDAERFATAVATLDVPSLLTRVNEHVGLVASRLAREARGSGLAERRAQLRQQLHEAVRIEHGRIAAPRSAMRVPLGHAEEPLTPVQEAVLNAFHVLALAEPTRLEVMTRFAADLTMLGQLDTAFLRRSRNVLESFVAELPLPEANVFTALLAQARGV